MDTPISEEEGSGVFADTMVDESNVDPVRQIQFEAMVCLVDKWLGKLDSLQGEVVARRFGLRGHDRSTLDAISKVMQINREKVRQIQNSGLRQLRHMVRDHGILQDIVVS